MNNEQKFRYVYGIPGKPETYFRGKAMTYTNTSQEIRDVYNTVWLIYSKDGKRVMRRNPVFTHSFEMISVDEAPNRLELNSERDCILFLRATGQDVLGFVFKEEVVLC